MSTKHTSWLGRAGETAAWAISVVAWALSFSAQMQLAGAHGFTSWEVWAWPATTDLAGLTGMLIALDQARRNGSTVVAWLIALAAAAVMVAANIGAAVGDPVAMLLHAWPPSIALACWYLLVHVRRAPKADMSADIFEADDILSANGHVSRQKSEAASQSGTSGGSRPSPRRGHFAGHGRAQAGRVHTSCQSATGRGATSDRGRRAVEEEETDMSKFIVILAALAVIACGQQGLTVQEAPTVKPTAIATAPPTPEPAQPITLSGTGSKVLDPIEIPKGLWRVSWKADGHDNFIVIVHGQQDTHLVNEIPPSPSSGEASFKSAGGRFVFDVKASQLTWTITLTRVSA